MRAIAVLAVVFAHAQFPGLRGGYLGVDTFFVISGYLITTILLRDAANSAISITKFYERRVRRIVPALSALLLAATLAALIFLSPYELVQYAYGLVASVMFVANLYFMAGTDYCAPKYETPLLHLWSLGVEEQFYLAYPLLLGWWLKKKPAAALLKPLLIVAIASLVLSEAMIYLLPRQAAFYFTLSRAWELMLGAIVAILTFARPQERSAATALRSEIIAALALAMIVVPIFLFNADTPWPGLRALWPALGTALLIYLHSGTRTLIARLLGSRPFVAVGLISYSLYLWHWPIFQFYQRAVLRTPTLTEFSGLIALSMVLAWFSWRFVEQPFRRRGQVLGRPQLFRAAGVCAGVFAACCVVILIGSGLPQRFPAPVRNVYAVMDGHLTPQLQSRQKKLNCYVKNHGAPYSFERCFTLAKDRPNILIWGDSFVGNYAQSFRQDGAAAGIHVIEASHFDCRPVLDESLVSGACARFNRSIMAHLDRNMTAVVISARFFNNQQLLPAFHETVRAIRARHIKVIVLAASLEYREAGPFFAARYVETGDPRWLDSTKALKPGLQAFDAALARSFQNDPGVTYVSVFDTLCPHQHCPMMVEGLAAQVDFGHLALPAALQFGHALWPHVYAALTARVPGFPALNDRTSKNPLSDLSGRSGAQHFLQ